MTDRDGPDPDDAREGSAGMDVPSAPGGPSIGPNGMFSAETSSLDRALTLVSFLRSRDDWDARQTARSLVPHLLEEAHETADAIREGGSDRIAAELGDLLLNLAFQIVVAEESGAFDREGVVQALERKMVHRHPHLFGDGRTRDWESLKAADRATEEHTGGALGGVPTALPPLVRAHRIQQRAAGVGFDWESADGALAKVREEVDEVVSAMDAGDPAALGEEVGDLLFSVVNLARLAGVHAHVAMDAATAKFERRFRRVEALAVERGIPLPGAPLEHLDALWEEVKAEPTESPPPATARGLDR